MNARSEEVLASVAPELAAKVRAAAAVLEAQGTYLLVVSGLRTAAEQDALYAQGRTAPGHVVTNAKAGQSMHQYALACDIVPYLSGEDGQLNWGADSPQFQAMVEALKDQGLVWGGDWKNIHDFDHFQMPGLPVSPSTAMQADYNGGTDLAAIWQKAAAGEYA